MSLIKNSFRNLCGYMLSAIVTLPALGITERKLGPELFGVFTLALAVMGYASILDAGLIRAVIREVATEKDNEENKLKTVSSAIVIIIYLSLTVSLLLLSFSGRIASLLNISETSFHNVSVSLETLVAFIPLFLITQIWLSILEGEEKFGSLNIYKSIMGAILAISPVLFILIKPSLMYAIIGLVLARFLCLILAFIICHDKVFKAKLTTDIPIIKRLFMFGGWITVSNIISPVLLYFDRLIVSDQLGAANVTFYTAPSEIISRFSIIPGAFSRALFPRLVNANNSVERYKTKRLITISPLIVITPIPCIGVLLSKKIIVLWMETSFFGEPGLVLSILLVDFILNGLA